MSGLDTENRIRTAGTLFRDKLAEHGVAELRARAVTTLQVNVGKRCNQACRHCHVDAGPHRTAGADNLQADVADRLLELLRSEAIELLDLTGGAPELNPHFRRLVRGAREAGVRVMDRCNLSILFEPGQRDLADFLAEHGVEVTASLPHYSRGPTDRQRGAGVFDASIEGLRELNARGYGGGGLVLNLVYNPAGAFLPGDQDALEADFKGELLRRFGVRFDHLFCITNMPIARYLDWLRRSGNEEAYVQALLDAFNPAAVSGVMCRDLVSVAPDGALHDCDFNQMVGMRLAPGMPRTIFDWDAAALAARPIVVADHCLGCTAGAGSSCGGQTA